VLSEGEYGYLERITGFVFAFGMLGMGITVAAMNICLDGADALGVLVIWFSPIPAYLLCWWAVAARDNFGELCQLVAVLCVVGMFSGGSETLLGIPVLIGLSWILSFLHAPARAIINFGRSEHRRI
jgi:hypothetical protein